MLRQLQTSQPKWRSQTLCFEEERAIAYFSIFLGKYLRRNIEKRMKNKMLEWSPCQQNRKRQLAVWEINMSCTKQWTRWGAAEWFYIGLRNGDALQTMIDKLCLKWRSAFTLSYVFSFYFFFHPNCIQPATDRKYWFSGWQRPKTWMKNYAIMQQHQLYWCGTGGFNYLKMLT